MEIVELNFSRLGRVEFDLLMYSLLNTALTCNDASIRAKVFNLRLLIMSKSKFLKVDESHGNNI